MAAFAPFLSLLAEVPDPRRAQGQLYKLPQVLLFSVLAGLPQVLGCRRQGVFSRRFFDREWTRGPDCEGGEDWC